MKAAKTNKSPKAAAKAKPGAAKRQATEKKPTARGERGVSAGRAPRNGKGARSAEGQPERPSGAGQASQPRPVDRGPPPPLPTPIATFNF